MRIIVFIYLRQNKSMLNYYKWYIYKYCMDHMRSMLKGCLEKYVERFRDD